MYCIRYIYTINDIVSILNDPYYCKIVNLVKAYYIEKPCFLREYIMRYYPSLCERQFINMHDVNTYVGYGWRKSTVKKMYVARDQNFIKIHYNKKEGCITSGITSDIHDGYYIKISHTDIMKSYPEYFKHKTVKQSYTLLTADFFDNFPKLLKHIVGKDIISPVFELIMDYCWAI